MNNNPVSPVDTINMTLFGVPIVAITLALQNRQWYVAAGLVLIIGFAAWWYHAQGSPSIPVGTLPITVPNPTNATLASPTTPTTVTSPVNPTVTVQPTPVVTPVMTTTATTNVPPTPTLPVS